MLGAEVATEWRPLVWLWWSVLLLGVSSALSGFWRVGRAETPVSCSLSSQPLSWEPAGCFWHFPFSPLLYPLVL